MPGEGGFFGGAGSGLGTGGLRASRAFRDLALAAGLLTAVGFAEALTRAGFFETTVLLLFDEESFAGFFFGASFLFERLAGFRATDGLAFLPAATRLAGEAFLVLGAAVILPGRLGFLEGDFLPFVARSFSEADECLLVVLVIRLLIGLPWIENEPAPR